MNTGNITDIGLITNPEKFYSIALGNTDQGFSFVVYGTYIMKGADIDLLGVNQY